MQFSMFAPDVKWSPPDHFPEINGDAAWDLECWDPDLGKFGPGWVPGRNGHIAGISVASEDFVGYFPFNHIGGGNMDAGAVLRWAKGQLKKPTKKIFANAPYDVGWLKKAGVEINPDYIEDIQIQAPLIDEHRRSYSLDSLGFTYFKERKSQDIMNEAFRSFGLKKGADIAKLPAIYVGEYAEQDAALTLKVWKKQNELIEEQNLRRIYELERSVIHITMMMRWNGVRVDVNKAEQISAQLKVRLDEIKSEIKRITGYIVDPWAPRSIAIALSDRGIKCPKTPKGQDSITAEFLETIDDPVAKLVLSSRKLQKIQGTFLDGHILGHAINGRVHCQFNQLRSDEGGTVSGRYSCDTPNLQQIPARDPEMGKLVRGLFLPNEGEKWCSGDYSAQEPRLTVHFAALAGLRGADEAASRYNTDPSTDYHQMVADLCGISRKAAKTINLGLAYGMGEPKLCHSLGLPTEWIEITDRRTGEPKQIEIAGEEGKRIIKEYDEGAPFIKSLFSACSNRAQTRGFITTLYGRRARFPLQKDGSRWFLHTAMNRLIQGSAADQTKEAMRQLFYDHNEIPLLQVHDELCFSVRDEDHAKHLTRIMETAVPLEVPSVCEAKVGSNWGECK